MGHITVLGKSTEELKVKARKVKETLKVKA